MAIRGTDSDENRCKLGSATWQRCLSGYPKAPAHLWGPDLEAAPKNAVKRLL